MSITFVISLIIAIILAVILFRVLGAGFPVYSIWGLLFVILIVLLVLKV